MNDKSIVARCYFCDSPLQIFTCMHFELVESHLSDIYIEDNFKGCSEICERLRQTKLFRNVVKIENKRNQIRNPQIKRLAYRTIIFLSYLNLSKIVERYLIKNQQYDEMYFSCQSLHMRLARLYFMRNQFPMKYVMYDEGIGSYVGQFKRKSKVNCFLEKIITRGDSDKVKIKRILYKPELDSKYVQEKEMIEKIIPIGDVDRENKNIYEYVFDHKIPELNNIKCIYFDGIREDFFHTKEELERMQSLYQMIEDIVGSDHMIVKAHPRANKSYPHKCIDFPSSNCPFEINLLGVSIDNILLISFSSSSVVMPKILFDSEPCVILLANMAQADVRLSQEAKDFFEKVKNLYENNDNFCIPNSEEELKRELRSHL